MLPLFLTGCFHKAAKSPAQQTAPAMVEDSAPIAKPEPVPPPMVEPPAPAPVQVEKKPAGNAQQHAKATVHPKKPTASSPAQHTQVASNGSPGVSAIGQLTSGGSDQGRETANAIAAIERGLNGIHRPFSDSEQKTAGQIREFLKKARLALDSGDADGARTLAAKAKVLLGELSK